MAKIRADAETKVLLRLLPEEVQSELHYNGKSSAIRNHPEYRDAIEAVSA